MPEHIRQEPKVLVSTENLTEQEWLAYRRQGIGGSDVAAILGISPFRTARDLYDDKLNIASAVDDTGNWVALEMGASAGTAGRQNFRKENRVGSFPNQEDVPAPAVSFHAGRCGLLCPPAKRENCDSGNQNDQLQRKRPLVEGRRGMCSHLLRNAGTALHGRYGHRRNLLLLSVWQQ